ncbi:hypothetical protein [Pantoea sp. Acro-807]|uniref:hypothetical protein n=1 Tax=Pantoea sp. Acro-807 TaxID=2608356 RepID=UPI00141A424F|nr:hypothetical protein [Pantoea sp. Acro-807]NIE71101.1 hypothetical protein [Pantoea sp. Acro-807]
MDIFSSLESEIRKYIINNEEKNIDDIESILNIIYDKIYEERNPDKVRLLIQSLSGAFHNIGDNSVAILLFVLMNKLSCLDGILIKERVKIQDYNDFEKISTFIENDLKKNTTVNFLSHRKADAGIGKDKLYAGLIKFFHHFLSAPQIEGESIAFPMLILINIWEISFKKDRTYEFFILFNSFLHKLSFHGHNQTIRDFAELSLILGHRNKKLHYSFFIKMSSFARQMNMIDALLSAQLMLHGYNYAHSEVDTFLSKALLELFITLRNLHLFPFTKPVYEAHERLKIDDKYGNHQFDMAYFNMLLTMGDKDVFDKVDEYLGRNDALLFGVQSGTPWTALLLNLKLIDPELFSSKINLTSTISRLEDDKGIKESTVLRTFRMAVSENVQDNKNAILEKVNHIQNSASYTDVSYELTSIYPLIFNLLKNSIREKNYEGVLISHTLSSDSSGISINERKSGLGMYKMEDTIDEKGSSIFENFLSYIDNLIKESENITFLWIGCNSELSYCLKLYKKEFNISKNYNFSSTTILDWEKSNIHKLAFNDQPIIEGFLSLKEDIWKRESDDFIYKQLPILIEEIDNKDVVIFRDAKIARYPINLIKDSKGRLLSDQANVSISTSINAYIAYEKHVVNAKKLKLWAPVEEGDIPINIAFGKICDEFSEDELIRVESLNPRSELNQDINIFISHGDKDDFYGFKAISPAEDMYFINEKDIFGKGKVAILFICHSGSSRPSLYATKINTLVYSLLNMGYEAVLAPAWSYNVMLAGIWTKAFIDAFRNGNSLSKSNFIANSEVKSEYIGVGAYAAMHLFGNDLLCSQNVND